MSDAGGGAPSVLITGASTGIGLAFARAYGARGWHVIPTHRGVQVPDTLAELAQSNPAVRPAQMDVTSQEEVARLAGQMAGEPLDLLINNAGITHDGDARAERQNIGSYDFTLMERIFATNVMGPLRVTQGFAGNLELGSGKTIVTVSSQHGSLGDPPPTLPELQGTFYCASKAALNREMQVVAEVLEPKGIGLLLFNPGAVKTERHEEYVREHGEAWPEDMFITLEQSVCGMIAAIEKGAVPGQPQFLNHDGSKLSW